MASPSTILELRQAAREIWQAAVEAGRPDVCIRHALGATPDGMTVRGSGIQLAGRLIVVGAGKAGASMSQAVEEILGDRVSGGLVVVPYGHRAATRRIEILEAAHPVPDHRGQEGMARMRTLVDGLTSEDLVLCLISGGGSALMPAPVPRITLEEKQAVTGVLLRAGATIRELNAVRKHLSAVKGGQLARWARPARVVSLIMSDVIRDPLDFIASGPTAPDTSTYADALAVIRDYFPDAPPSVRNHLARGARGEVAETPKPGDATFARVSNIVIGNNRLLLDAAARCSRQLGFNCIVLSSELDGEARDVGRLFSGIAKEILRSGNPIQLPACVLAGGETTVTVRGAGLGGRNLEMATAWALAIAGEAHPACFASIASDGTDGPTDTAGGLVDTDTHQRASNLGLCGSDSLRNNDSFHFLDALGDTVRTGPTATNLMDLQILLVGGRSNG